MDTFTQSPMSYTHLGDARQRALEDLLESERTLRQTAEASIRDLRQVLLETALRLNGNRLEEIRRKDPSAPVRWTPADWRRFLSSISMPAGWNDTQALDRQKRELAQQIEGLKAALTHAERLLAEERERARNAAVVEPAAVSAAAASVPVAVAEGMTPPLDALVEQTRQALKNTPARPPSSFSKVLDGGGRTGGDRARVWARYWAILYLVGRCQVSAAMEIEQALSELFDVAAGSGSIRRVVGDLVDRHLLEAKLLSLSSPRTALKAVRLTADGERLFEAVFGTKPLENDWLRLIRLHEGDRFEEHTLAVLAFAMHARRRGWATQILPEADGNAKPDLCVADADGRRYVEVELSVKENTAKWRNLAGLNGGTVAVCAGTMEGRKRLVGDCKLLQLKGAATDLESLIAVPFKSAQSSALWLEAW